MTVSSGELRKVPLSSSEINVRGEGQKFPKKSCLRKHSQSTNVDSSNTRKESSELLSFSSSSSSLSWLSEDDIKKVSFDRIEVREFPIILGDNPSPNDGIPVTIGWKPQRRGIFDIDYYESNKYDNRRCGKELLLPANYRAKLAIIGGATISKIGRTAVEITKIQKRRAQSSQKSPLELLREGFDRKLHPNRKISAFSRVPNEAPSVLSSWKANGERLKAIVNAAA